MNEPDGGNNTKPRIGVFVCHCGSNIGGLIDCKKLAEYASTLPDVVHSEDNLYTCSENGLTSIKKAIKDHSLNKVVVASCTPRTHEPLFRETVQEEGVNPYLFNFVNIRDQCTWVHMKQPEAAFEKARDLIRMGVAKAKLLEALSKNVLKVNQVAIIIGGGVAGISAATSLSKQGFKVHLVEKKDTLGGNINSFHSLFPGSTDSADLAKKLRLQLEGAGNVQLHLSSRVTDLSGYVGNFGLTVEKDGKSSEINAGAIIVATGASIFKPIGMYNYDGKKVITQLELEQQLKEKRLPGKNVVMIQCVGARDEARGFCSNVCCSVAVKNAMVIKHLDPAANVTILYRDMYTPGVKQEQEYKMARARGVIFLRYPEDNKPTVEKGMVRLYTSQLGDTISIPADTVVLSTPMIPDNDNKFLSALLKVPLEENGFFLEAHVKLRPVDFATDGIFIAGCAKWPASISESINQGLAAASRASTILSHDTIEVDGSTSYIPEWNSDLCKGCEVCISVCPYHAIIKNEQGAVEIIQAQCKGCGVCAATCTKGAIVSKHFTNEQILSEINALGME